MDDSVVKASLCWKILANALNLEEDNVYGTAHAVTACSPDRFKYIPQNVSVRVKEEMTPLAGNVRNRTALTKATIDPYPRIHHARFRSSLHSKIYVTYHITSFLFFGKKFYVHFLDVLCVFMRSMYCTSYMKFMDVYATIW